MSWFIRRSYSEFSGALCAGCTTGTFFAFELTTLVCTWWGMIGSIVGPFYLLHNMLEYVTAMIGFIFKRPAGDNRRQAVPKPVQSLELVPYTR